MEAQAADKAFGEAAVARGFITKGQLEECERAAQLVTQAGLNKPLSDIMLEKGLITEVQAEQIGRAVQSPESKTIGGFELLQKLGEGGMGVVFKAHQASMDRMVALKILPERLAKDKQFVSRFFREARVAAKLDHPNIVRGIDVGSAGSDYYFAMEYVEGKNVGDVLEERGRFSEKEALEIIVQVAKALDHAHKHDMIHRDIKPDNILLTPDGTAKLLDLGLARSTAGDQTRMTVTGTAMGTPHYISPEQARGEADVDIRTDIYSLGVTLYHLLVGTPPFDGETVAVIITKTLTETPPPVHDIVSEVSESTSRIVEKMMAKEKGSRYESPAQVAADIEQVLAGGEVSTTVSSPAGGRALSSTEKTMPMPSSGQMRMMSDADIAKIRADTAAEFAAAGKSKTLPIVLSVVALAIVGAIATPFVLEKLNKPDDPAPVAGGGNPTPTPTPTPNPTPTVDPVAAQRELDEKADAENWTRMKATASRMAEESNFAGALGALDAFMSSAKTTKFNAEVMDLRSRIDKQRIEAVKALRAAERAKISSTEEKPEEKAAKLMVLAAKAEEGEEFDEALELLKEAEKLGATIALDVIRVERKQKHAKALDAARELVKSKSWKKADAALAAILEDYPGDKTALELVEEVKKGRAPPPVLALDLGDGVTLDLIYVKPGRFRMGSTEGWGDEKPVHEVVLTKGFYIGKYEVTQKQYHQVMGVNRSTFKGDDNPVEQVSWHEADDFCKRIGERTGKRARLPSEAEWEYASRSGSAGNYCFGNDEAVLDEFGWYALNSGKQTHPVGTKKPNAWGIHDMHGNVWEWTADWYDAAYYAKSPREDPTGPAESTGRRVLRGGCMDNKASGCTSTERSRSRPSGRDNDAGFRIVVAP